VKLSDSLASIRKIIFGISHADNFRREQMKKIAIYSNDDQFTAKLKSVYHNQSLMFLKEHQLPDKDSIVKTAIVDGDYINDMEKLISDLKKMGIPAVAIKNEFNGENAVQLINYGFFSLLLKEYPPQKIKQELRKVEAKISYLSQHINKTSYDKKLKNLLLFFSKAASEKKIIPNINQMIPAIHTMFALKFCSFYLFKDNRFQLKLFQSADAPKRNPPDINTEELKRQYLEILKTGKLPLYLNKTETMAIHPVSFNLAVLLPIRIKNLFYGFIYGEFKENQTAISLEDKILLKIIMEQINVALANFYIYKKMKISREKIIRKERENLFDQMMISLNHEINNPLSIISMEAQLLQKGLTGEPGHIESRLERIEVNIDRIKTILEKMSSLNINAQKPVQYIKNKQMLNLCNEN
jgi:hypothetical protein